MDGGSIRLTDDGCTLCDLEQTGLDLSTDRIRDMLETILRVNGVSMDGDELYVIATADNFPERKNDLLNSIMRVSDMRMMVTEWRRSIADDVVEPR